MALTASQESLLLSAARDLIGTSYATLDCSHFVQQAYEAAGLVYPYRNTATFTELCGGYFEQVTDGRKGGDVLLLRTHMGLWDPDGCKVLTTSRECIRIKNDLKKEAAFLSSRSGGNRGPDFGLENWWGEVLGVYRWKAHDGEALAATPA